MTERRVHNSRKLFGFIILDLGVDVHRNFAVLVTREVLDRFGINRGIYQIGDICVHPLSLTYTTTKADWFTFSEIIITQK